MSEIKNLKNQQVNPEEVLYVRVDGMYCEHCFQTVRAALLALDGVETVSFRQIVAELRGSTLPDTDTLLSVIRDAGYEANPSRVSIDPRRAAGRVHWYVPSGNCARQGGGRRWAGAPQGRQRSMAQFPPEQIKGFYGSSV